MHFVQTSKEKISNCMANVVPKTRVHPHYVTISQENSVNVWQPPY